MFGLLKDGVGGTTLLAAGVIPAFAAGVTIVSDKLLGLRLGGLAGLLKAVLAVSRGARVSAESNLLAARGSDVAAPRGLPTLPVVLTARFFRFRARFPGAKLRVFISKNGEG